MENNDYRKSRAREQWPFGPKNFFFGRISLGVLWKMEVKPIAKEKKSEISFWIGNVLSIQYRKNNF